MKKNLLVILCLSFLASCASGLQKSTETSKNVQRSLDSVKSHPQPIRDRAIEPFWDIRRIDRR